MACQQVLGTLGGSLWLTACRPRPSGLPCSFCCPCPAGPVLSLSACVPSDLRYVPYVPRHISRLSPVLIPLRFLTFAHLLLPCRHHPPHLPLPVWAPPPSQHAVANKHGHDTRPWATQESTHHRIILETRRSCCCSLSPPSLSTPPGIARVNRASQAVRYRSVSRGVLDWSVPGLPPVTHTEKAEEAVGTTGTFPLSG